MSEAPYQPWQSQPLHPGQPYVPTPPGAVPPPGAPGSSYSPPMSPYGGAGPRQAPHHTYAPPAASQSSAVPQAAPRLPRYVAHALPVSTTSEIPGRTVARLLGPVVGTVTRPRDLQPHPELALFLTQIRQDATRAMVEMARQAGADAIIGFAYAGGAISSMSSEITAYGTAVTLEPVPDEPAIAVPAPAPTASDV